MSNEEYKIRPGNTPINDMVWRDADHVDAITIGEPDYVNHPPHYTREGGMECIDEMVLAFGKSVVADYCLCNVWKYRYRAADKNGSEDLAKSDWYMRKYKELTEKKPRKVNYLGNSRYEIDD